MRTELGRQEAELGEAYLKPAGWHVVTDRAPIQDLTELRRRGDELTGAPGGRVGSGP